MLRNRIIVSLLWILSLVGISFYGGSVSYGFFIMMTLIPVIAWLYIFLVWFRYSIYQKLEGKTFVSNHAIPYFFTLQNEDHFAFAALRVFFYSDYSSLLDLTDGVEYELLPGTGVTRDTSLICRYRGVYNVGIRYVEITDYLRLFRVRCKNREPLEVNIRPDVIPLEELRSFRLPRILRREIDREASVLQPTVRAYAPGDSPRRIHWKASAREGRLLTRRSADEEQQTVDLLLSTHRVSEAPADYLPAEHKLLEIALALANFFQTRSIPVRATHMTESVQTQLIESRSAFQTYYETCAHLIYSSAYNDDRLFGAVAKNPSLIGGRVVFFVLSELSVRAEETARRLNENGISVIAYIVTRDPSSVTRADRLPRTEWIPVSPDDDLKEVL